MSDPSHLDFQIMNAVGRVRRCIEARDTGAQKAAKLRMWARRDRAGATRGRVILAHALRHRYSDQPSPITEAEIRRGIRCLKARAVRRSKAADAWAARQASADADIRAVVRAASPDVLTALLECADERVRFAVISSL